MTAAIRLGEDDYLAFSRLACRRAMLRSLAIAAVVVLLIGALALAAGDPLDALTAVVAGLAVAVGLYAVQYALLPRKARRIFAESALLHEPHDYSFDEIGLMISQPSGHVRQRWGDIVRWDEDALIFALYVNRLQAFLLPPAQAGPDVLAFVRANLRRSGLAGPGKRRR